MRFVLLVSEVSICLCLEKYYDFRLSEFVDRVRIQNVKINFLKISRDHKMTFSAT